MKCEFDWVDINERLPAEFGWYEIKTPYGEFEAPYVRNGAGNFVWVLPDSSIISHWKSKTIKL